MEKIKNVGVMLDCSRNAVLNLESVKKMIDVLSLMGYNYMMLYTEDTYEIKEEPLFGYLRGRYTTKEMKEIDSYGRLKGIEVIPCIQTLAHLNQMFKWLPYNNINDIDDVLLIGDNKTYELIDHMLKTIRECFTTNKIHLGMDEAFKVGLGKYLNNNGFKDRKEILLPHLKKVVEMASSYGFKPMIWSDMFYRLAANSPDYYTKDVNVNDDIKKEVPNNLTLVYWDYYHKDTETYDNIIKGHKKFNNEIAFAGGIWTWVGFAPQNEYTFRVTKPAIEACLKNNIDNVSATAWKDDGAECSTYAALPSLFYFIECAKGIFDLKRIKEDFFKTFKAPFDNFMTFDKLNEIDKKERSDFDIDFVTNSSKYMLYSDPFLGFLDSTVSGDEGKHYKKIARKIKLEEKEMGEFEYLSEYYYYLSKTLEYKYALGYNTRMLYQKKDTNGLKSIINDYSKSIYYLKKFIDAFRTLWFIENKPHGFDVQEIRLGGILERLISSKERLIKYVDRKIEKIPELEEKLIDFQTGSDEITHKLECFNSYVLGSTINRL